MSKLRNNSRPLHIDNKLWQYRWGKQFINIYTPDGKRHNIEKDTIFDDVFTAKYGEKEYKKRLRDTKEWDMMYAWDAGNVIPADFDLKILSFTPNSLIKEYIIRNQDKLCIY